MPCGGARARQCRTDFRAAVTGELLREGRGVKQEGVGVDDAAKERLELDAKEEAQHDGSRLRNPQLRAPTTAATVLWSLHPWQH